LIPLKNENEKRLNKLDFGYNLRSRERESTEVDDLNLSIIGGECFEIPLVFFCFSSEWELLR